MNLLLAIRQHPEKVELRLADSVEYYLDRWDIDQYLNETWRWC